MSDIFHVTISLNAEKDLKKVPLVIGLKLEGWVEEVGHRGLREVRKIPGYHDEPLKGKEQVSAQFV